MEKLVSARQVIKILQAVQNNPPVISQRSSQSISTSQFIRIFIFTIEFFLYLHLLRIKTDMNIEQPINTYTIYDTE